MCKSHSDCTQASHGLPTASFEHLSAGSPLPTPPELHTCTWLSLDISGVTAKATPGEVLWLHHFNLFLPSLQISFGN